MAQSWTLGPTTSVSRRSARPGTVPRTILRPLTLRVARRSLRVPRLRRRWRIGSAPRLEHRIDIPPRDGSRHLVPRRRSGLRRSLPGILRRSNRVRRMGASTVARAKPGSSRQRALRHGMKITGRLCRGHSALSSCTCGRGYRSFTLPSAPAAQHQVQQNADNNCYPKEDGSCHRSTPASNRSVL